MKKGFVQAALCALTLAAPAAAGPGSDVLGKTPIFSESEAYAAGMDVQLGDLPRGARGARAASLLVGAVNLSEQTASCRATLLDRNGLRLADIPFEVPAKSSAREDAAQWLGRIDAVTITCDQSFYPFGVTTEGNGAPSFAKGIGPNGACQRSPMLTKDSKSGHYTLSVPGLFHEATKANPKGIICIQSPAALHVAKAVYEWDVTVGPWSSRDKSGLHNLAYFFLDRYRSGVVGNVNAAGPNKSFLKFMQNVGMAPGSNTNEKSAYGLQPGVTYHFRYTFDAHNKLVTFQTFLGPVEVKKFSKECRPGNNQTLMVQPYGKGESQAGLAMVAEWGNYIGQHHPEEATVGWRYLNFKVDLTLK